MIQFRCDICGAITTEEERTVITLPYLEKTSIEAKESISKLKAFDLCGKCKDRYKKVILEHFVTLTEINGTIMVIKRGTQRRRQERDI